MFSLAGELIDLFVRMHALKPVDGVCSPIDWPIGTEKKLIELVGQLKVKYYKIARQIAAK